jgi:hypothetical protein
MFALAMGPSRRDVVERSTVHWRGGALHDPCSFRLEQKRNILAHVARCRKILLCGATEGVGESGASRERVRVLWRGIVVRSLAARVVDGRRVGGAVAGARRRDEHPALVLLGLILTGERR